MGSEAEATRPGISETSWCNADVCWGLGLCRAACQTACSHTLPKRQASDQVMLEWSTPLAPCKCILQEVMPGHVFLLHHVMACMSCTIPGLNVASQDQFEHPDAARRLAPSPNPRSQRNTNSITCPSYTDSLLLCQHP